MNVKQPNLVYDKFQKKRKYGIRSRYRFIRKIINLYRASILYIITTRYRLYRRLRFKVIRLAIFLFFKIWIKEVVGIENIPLNEPAILVSNHLSYYDFLIFGSLLKNYVVFVAAKKIKQTPFIQWFTKLHHVVYVERDHPGITFFRDIMRHLESGRLIIVYPEGTRSRTGKMLMPNHGFVKLAMMANIPIIPVAMKGTYEILPPQRHIPRLRRCTVIICKKIYISPENTKFRDIFFRRTGMRKFDDLRDEEMQEIAFRIMNEVRILAGEEWDDSALNVVHKFKLHNIQIENDYCRKS